MSISWWSYKNKIGMKISEKSNMTGYISLWRWVRAGEAAAAYKGGYLMWWWWRWGCGHADRLHMQRLFYGCGGGGRVWRGNLLAHVSVYHLLYVFKVHPYPEYVSLHKPAQVLGHTQTVPHDAAARRWLTSTGKKALSSPCYLLGSKVPVFLDRPM